MTEWLARLHHENAAMRAVCGNVACLQHMLDFEAALAKAATSSGNLAIPLVKALTAAVASTDAEAARHLHWGATA
jgi:3-carboxy-cis,cis-muconate cycloisomerase